MVPAAGFIAYLAFWLIRSGDPLLPLQAPALWQRTAQVPFLMIGKGIGLGVLGVGDADGLYWTADLLLSGAIVGALLVGWRSLRVSYVVYAACTFAILFTFAYSPRPFLGIPRYASGDVSRLLDHGSEAFISCIRRRDGHIRRRLHRSRPSPS